MGGEVELAEEGIHEAALFVVVGLSEGEDDVNMGFDVYRLKNGDWWIGGDDGASERDTIIRRGGRSVFVEIGLERVDAQRVLH
jgi:hypothetical protein